jgi:hypothetical protein
MQPTDLSTMDKTTQNALFVMASLSPKVQSSIEQELYRTTSDSDLATDSYILEDALVCLLKDLETIGVVLNSDPADIVQSHDQLFDFLSVCFYLFPTSVYHMIKTHQEMASLIQHLTEGSLEDNTTLLQTYLSELGGLDGQIPIAEHLTDALDQYYSLLTQTDSFTDTMFTLHDLLNHERLLGEADPVDHAEYRRVIHTYATRLSGAVDLYKDMPFYDILKQASDKVVQDWCAPVHYADYRLLFVVSPESIPETLKDAYTRKHYHYCVSYPWCPDYYLARHQTPTRTQTILMCCFAYAMTWTPEQYKVSRDAIRHVSTTDLDDSRIVAHYGVTDES